MFGFNQIQGAINIRPNQIIMKNQSSLNDIFRFVQLRGGNILKAFPIVETDTITNARVKPISERKEQAFAYIESLKFNTKKLNFGQVIETERDNLLSNTNTGRPKVSKLYNNLNGQGVVDFDSDEFNKDLEVLSELIYFSNYHKYYNVKPDHIKLYLTYQILNKAHSYFQFRDLYLDKFFNIDENSNAFIKSVGIADLLVVKQHLLRYEETEIAHIENVMKGETRSREHRFLDRFEETLIYENEKSVETEKESEITERFEMNRETSKTIQEDQKLSTDLSVSGTYGPTTVASNLAFSIDTSETTESSSSSEYAKDIMDRSLEKVNERVRTERITKILKENETKDLHSFTNVLVEGATEDLDQISGIYQFVDKIYEAQVFNYGKRQMFDLMIPEPASYLHFLNNSDSNISDHDFKAPPLLKINPFDIDFLHRNRQVINPITGESIEIRSPNPKYYTHLAALYGATSINQPPEEKLVTFSHQQPASNEVDGPLSLTAEDGRIEGRYLSPIRVFDIAIPAKYLPKSMQIEILAFSDTGQNVTFTFLTGKNNVLISIPRLSNVFIGTNTEDYELVSGYNNIEFNEEDYGAIMVDENKMKIGYFATETANHTFSFKITCKPSEELIRDWQLETYAILQAAYQNRLMKYESKLAQFNADRKAQENVAKNNYGVPPSKQKQVMLTELKKHAVSIFTDNFMDDSEYTSEFPVVVVEDDENPPKIDRTKAKKQGDFIRFFEQAFEWSQMQYAMYPYFWSDQNDWGNKFKQDDPNYEYQQFLQASAARLVLSVRLGFEESVAYYLETGNIWGGVGVPSINDPLYLTIVDEIREQSGNTEKEPVPDGKPWEVRLPTSLIKLKQKDSLPKWRIVEGTDWEWEKDESITE